MSIPVNSPGPLAFIPPVVAPIAANNIVPLAIAAGAGVAGLSAVIAGAPLAAGVALGFGLVAGAELLFPRPLGGQNPQGWGLLSGRSGSLSQTVGGAPLINEFEFDPVINFSGQYSETGTTRLVSSGVIYYTVRLFGVDEPRQTIQGPTVTNHIGFQGISVIRGSSSIGVVARRANGTTAGVGVGQSGGGAKITGLDLSISASNPAADSVNFAPTEVAVLADLKDRSWLFNEALESTALPAPLPLPAYVPQPATVPAVPDAEPVTQPEPATPAEPPRRVAPPLPVPSSPPWVRPSRPRSIPGSVPGQFPSNPTQPTQPTAPDGTVTPTQPGPVTPTQPGSIVPWPGAPSIPAIGPAPRADLVGIAQEVGRIERKLDLINSPTSPGNLIDLLGEARRLAQAIWELLTSLSAGTTYTLDSPCEVDDEGVKLPPIEIEAAGATNAFGVLMNRTDALAELIQAHKNLKQPGCKHKLAGEIVTVNFEQIE